MSVTSPSETHIPAIQKKASAPGRMQAFADIWLPRLVLSPTVFASLLFVYGFIAFTAYLSFTDSRLMPNYELTGFGQYQALFELDRWWVSAANLGIFGGLFILFCLIVGLLLAVFLDQKIRMEGALRAIYLYPMALSFIVTGVAWKWILNPGLGLEKWFMNGAFRIFPWTGWWTQTWQSIPLSSRVCGSHPVLSWPCFWRACAVWMTRLSKRPWWMAPAYQRSTAVS